MTPDSAKTIVEYIGAAAGAFVAGAGIGSSVNAAMTNGPDGRTLVDNLRERTVQYGSRVGSVIATGYILADQITKS